jgi:hypothetical protein
MARKPRTYFTLIARDDSPGCPWSIEFGDYVKSVVRDEAEEYRDQGLKTKIIETGETQREINEAVAAINKAAGYWSDAAPETATY